MKFGQIGIWIACVCFICCAGLLAPSGVAQEKESEEKTQKTKQEQEQQNTEKVGGEQVGGEQVGGEQVGGEQVGGEQKGSEKDADAGKTAAGENSSQPAEQTTGQQDDLTSLKQQWAALNAKMDATKKAFDESQSPTESASLRDDYVSQIDDANELIAKIKAAAVEKIATGELEQSVVETVLGIMINDAVFERDVVVMDTGQQLIDAGVDSAYFEAAANANRLSIAGKEMFTELISRKKEAEADDLPRVTLTTSKGDIVLELFENEAPQTVGNFINLVESGYYNGIKFHRVLEGFMAQAGDPKTKDAALKAEWGTGGPGYNIYCECYQQNARRHFTGSLSMAKRTRDTGGSQFFITFDRTSHLDGQHTVFGRVIDGMDVVNSIQRINPQVPSDVEPDTIISAKVDRKRDHEYVPTKVSE